MARIDFENVGKSFDGVEAVRDLNLAIRDGTFVAILGPSGCGKSTTLFMLAGIYLPTTGNICFDGHVVNEVEAKDRNVGIVFQSYALYPHLTVRDNIGFPLRLKRVPKAEAARRIEEAARLVRVDELLERRPAQLSGGQQQRVALARALVKRPQLLLLDEPLSNLDASLRLTMRTEIRALQQELGVTTVLVTHDQIEAMTMADLVVCMKDGGIQQVAPPHELYKAPANLFVAGFIGAPPINLLPGNLAEGQFRRNGLRLACAGQAPAGDAMLGVRPEHLQLAAEGIPGRVRAIEPMGRESLYHLDSELGNVLVLVAEQSRQYAPGESVRIAFRSEDTLFFDAAGGERMPGVTALPPTP